MYKYELVEYPSNPRNNVRSKYIYSKKQYNQEEFQNLCDKIVKELKEENDWVCQTSVTKKLIKKYDFKEELIEETQAVGMFYDYLP